MKILINYLQTPISYNCVSTLVLFTVYTQFVSPKGDRREAIVSEEWNEFVHETKHGERLEQKILNETFLF